MNEVYLLSKFDVSSFSMTRDFQTDNFADFEQFKIDSYFADFGQFKIDPNSIYLTNFAQVTAILLTLGKTLDHK